MHWKNIACFQKGNDRVRESLSEVRGIKKEPSGKRINGRMFQKEGTNCAKALSQEGIMFEGLKGTMLYLGIWK